MRILTVLGARPQFVKSFPVSAALDAAHEETLVHTGQHYDEKLSEVFFDELGLDSPTYDLGVGSAPHAIQTADIMRELDPIVAGESPDALLLYGDTNSTLAGALVGAKRAVDVLHVEAGLRSGNQSMPEEHNRVVTDHVSDVLFAPSADAERNLEREGLGDRAHRPGDVMYDAIRWATDVARSNSTIIESLDLTDTEYVLATVHRPRNTDDETRLAAILDAFERLDRTVVLPAHPRTVDRLEEYKLRERAADAVMLVDPVSYLDFVRLLDGAERVATDSGGVQKEAFFLEKPCVTLREETEWVETVEAGWNVLAGADPDEIHWGLTDFETPTTRPEPYGTGDAATRIAEVLADA